MSPKKGIFNMFKKFLFTLFLFSSLYAKESLSYCNVTIKGKNNSAESVTVKAHVYTRFDTGSTNHTAVVTVNAGESLSRRIQVTTTRGCKTQKRVLLTVECRNSKRDQALHKPPPSKKKWSNRGKVSFNFKDIAKICDQ